MLRPVLHLNQHPMSSSASTADAHDSNALQQAEDQQGNARFAREDRIDEELAQSFPASDPPSGVSGGAQ